MKDQELQQLEARTDSLDPDSISSYDTNINRHKQLVTIKIRHLDRVMAVLRIAIISLTVLISLARARYLESNLSTSEDLVASINSTSNDRGIKMKHNWPTCPLWKYHKYHNSSCECGSGIHNVVICRDNQSTVSIVSCNCISNSDDGDGVVVGACPFLCGNYFHMNIDSVNNLITLCDRDIRQNRQG